MCGSRSLAPTKAQGFSTRFFRRRVAQFDRLHRLPQPAIAQNNHRRAVLVGQIERLEGEVEHFLGAVGRQHDGAVIAIAAAAGGLEVVALGRGDVAQSPDRRAAR